jgi:DNA-binding NtrC family response regulator
MTKPFSLEELRLLLARVASHLKLKTENRVLRERRSGPDKVLAASSAADQKWTSSTGSLLRPLTVFILS